MNVNLISNTPRTFLINKRNETNLRFFCFLNKLMIYYSIEMASLFSFFMFAAAYLLATISRRLFFPPLLFCNIFHTATIASLFPLPQKRRQRRKEKLTMN